MGQKSQEVELCSLDHENMLKMCESKIQGLENENFKIREFYDKKLNKLTSHYERMVVKYYHMINEHKEAGDKLELSIKKNARFKFAAQCLPKKIEELSICDVGGCLEKSDSCNDDAFNLEECIDKLDDELDACDRRIEEISAEQDRTEKQLLASEDTKRALAVNIDRLIVASKSDWDRVDTAPWQTMDRLSAKLIESGRAKDQLRRTLNDRADEIGLAGRSATAEADRLRVVIAGLTVNLNEQRLVEHSLRARVAELEEVKRTHMDMFCRWNNRPSSGSLHSLDPDQSSCGSTRDPSRSRESCGRDYEDPSELQLHSLRLDCGEDAPRP